MQKIPHSGYCAMICISISLSGIREGIPTKSKKHEKRNKQDGGNGSNGHGYYGSYGICGVPFDSINSF